MRFDSAHPDKAELLAWAEGELSWFRTRMIARHVRLCWQCKGQVSALQAMARAVTNEIGQLPEPSNVDTAKAYWRFREACMEIEDQMQSPRLRLRPIWTVLAGACVAILTTAGLAYMNAHYPRQPLPKPKHVTVRPANPAYSKPAPPDTPVEPVRKQIATVVAPNRPARVAEPPLIRVTDPTEEDLLAVEIQALAALHRSRFCLNSGIAVRRVRTAVAVSGLVQSRDHRDRLTWLLQGIGRSEILQIELTDAAEAADNIPAALDLGPPSRAGIRIVPPIEGWLRESLQVGSRTTEREMFNLMNALLLESERVSSEGWAIRHLAEQFPVTRTLHLTPEAAGQLLQMVDDHAIALDNSLRTLRGRLHLALGTPPQPYKGRLEAFADDPWQTRAGALQRRSEEIARQLLESLSAPTRTAASDIGGPHDFAALLSLLDGNSTDCMEFTADLRAIIHRYAAGGR